MGHMGPGPILFPHNNGTLADREHAVRLGKAHARTGNAACVVREYGNTWSRHRSVPARKLEIRWPGRLRLRHLKPVQSHLRIRAWMVCSARHCRGQSFTCEFAMHATQQQVLEILQEKGCGTAKELADWLQIKPPSLRYHLLALELEELIERIPHQPSGDVGRPAVTYALTPDGVQAVQHCTPWLVRGLLDQLRARSEPDQLDEFFRAMGGWLARDFDAEHLQDLSLDERLSHVRQTLSHHGYSATLEVLDQDGEQEIALQVRVCPYGDLPQKHAELCTMDRELVNALVGQPCVQEQVMARGASCCSFHLMAQDPLMPDLT